ncbi:MAG: aquaporin family protein [Flavobacteriales bacterium]|nr:aquaporin family protein [Flavobacteriales bacterium]PCH86624.1 MAG: porin [Flavobacteriales bacterium]
MKNYLVEFIGTFFLVFVIGLTGNPIAIGCILMVMVYMGGHISGAHYNPAVTIAILIRKKIETKDALMYIVFQILGAALAAICYQVVKGETFAPAPADDASMISALLVEVLFTFALVSVILNVATHSKTEGNSYYGLAIGFTVLAAAFAGGPISGGAFNPAVGTGPILIDTFMGSGSMANLGIYWLGPVLGGALGALVFKYINPDE